MMDLTSTVSRRAVVYGNVKEAMRTEAHSSILLEHVRKQWSSRNAIKNSAAAGHAPLERAILLCERSF
jgi:hypothetical protein